jgi:hypothetical protein
MRSYKRQLSNVGAAILSVMVASLLLGSGVLLFQAMLFFGPVILAMSLGIIFKEVALYPVRRRLEFLHPAGLFFAAWAVAVPVVAVLVPIADAACAALPMLPSLPEQADREVNAFLLGLIFLQVGATLLLFIRQYGRTPESATFQGELTRKGWALAIIVGSFYFFALALVFAAPVGTLLVAVLISRRGGNIGEGIAKVFFVIAAFPSLVLGPLLIRRAFSLLEVQRYLESLALSSVRGAAMGLVELQGKAVPLREDSSGPIMLVTSDGNSESRNANAAVVHVDDFFLDDGTGRVRVRMPQGCRPGLGRPDRARQSFAGRGSRAGIPSDARRSGLRPGRLCAGEGGARNPALGAA